MKKKILVVVIILASIGLLITLFTLPTYFKNKKEEERWLMIRRERYLELLGDKSEIWIEGKPYIEVINNKKEKKILLNDHVTATISEKNFTNIYFSTFVWNMRKNNDWDYEIMREKLEKEIAMLADKEHGIAVFYDRETELGKYSDWAMGAHEEEIIKKVELAIKDLGNGGDTIKVQENASELGVSLSEFYEIIYNYEKYPEHWEKLYPLAKEIIREQELVG